MGQIDRVDEVRSRRYKRMAIAEPEEGRVGPNPVRILDAAGKLVRIISSEALANRGDVVPARHAPEIGPRDAEHATVYESPSAWRRAKSHRKRTAA